MDGLGLSNPSGERQMDGGGLWWLDAMRGELQRKARRLVGYYGVAVGVIENANFHSPSKFFVGSRIDKLGYSGYSEKIG
jgi:hypothetical protein